MTYYQILKQRRIDLKLTIQDVSVQTRLAPEYIQAIEENNLDVFSDDYSFVRYFVHSYANAIGVNWNAIQNEVDQTIKYYAHKKNMALTMAQQQIVKNIPNEKATKRNKKNRSRFQSSVTRVSRSLHWPKQKFSRMAIYAVVALGVCLLAANGISSYMSAHEESAREAARKAELREKEQETQRLSEQRKETQFNESKTEIDIQAGADGTYYITSASPMPWTIELAISVPKETKIELYQNDELIAGSSEEMQDSDFSTILTCDQVSTYRLVISDYNNNAITLNGQQVSYTPDAAHPSHDPVELTFEFGTAAPVDEEPQSEGAYYGYDQSVQDWGYEEDPGYYDGSGYDYDYGYGG